MKIMIAGANGQLGTELQRQLAEGKNTIAVLPSEVVNATVCGFDIDTLSITDKDALEKYILTEKPDVVINCSAYTNVDGCEENPQLAFEVNAVGARNIAIACEKANAKLIHISTDYVFSGEDSTPYSEYNLPAPQSVYGKSKWLGEEYVKTFCSKHFIVRTAWLYGYAGGNFVKTMLRVLKQNGEAKVVNDQLGNPTNAEDLAYHLLVLAQTEEYGTYHCTGEGVCSWYDFTREIARFANINASITPCTTEEFPRPAKRPAFSALENRMLAVTVGNHMRPWQEALQVFFEHYQMED